MKRLSWIPIAIFAAFSLVQAADQYRPNPYTGKLDNIGTYANVSAQYRKKFREYSTFRNISTPAQIFNSHTGVRYPVFNADNSYFWQQPLDMCGATGIGTPVYDGAQGPRGLTGAISVGTTTTLEPGQSAYVVFTGPSTARIASFGIPKGATGDPGTLTQAAVFGAADDKSNLPFILQGNADSDVKAQMLYSSGETSLWVTSGGMLFMQDKTGHITWGWNNDTRTMVFSNYSFASSRKSMTIDRFGQVTQYAANGSTVIFRNTTTGRIKRYYKSTGLLAEHIEPDGKRTLYRPDGVTARMINYTAGATVF